MNEIEKQELAKAISQLSEEDQAEIAGGQIKDEQCEKIKQNLKVAYGMVKPELVALEYGGPIPYTPKIDRSTLTADKSDKKSNTDQ